MKPESSSAAPISGDHNSFLRRVFLLRGKEGALFLAVLLLVWQVVSFFHFSGSYLFPTPEKTVVALWHSLPELARGTYSSFLILLPGYGLAVVTGIAWGLLAGTVPALERMFSPFSRLASPIPPTIYIPYAIALLPTFRSAAGFIVFAGAFWPIFLNTATGAASVPAHYRDSARILGLGRLEYLRRVVFPASLPHIFAGLSIGLVFSFIMLTVAELFGAQNGLGRFIQLYADYADYPRMAAGILFTGAVVFVTTGLLERIRRRALFWVR
jgi:NitT/TauT family transport system permease protein